MKFDVCIQNNMDQKAFYLMVKAMKIQLAMGKKHLNQDGKNSVPCDGELAEVLQRLAFFTSVAKYIRNCALLLVQHDSIPTFAEFEAKLSPSREDCLLHAIKKFVAEVEEMERAVLVPCLLKDHSLTEFGFTKQDGLLQTENVHEVYSFLKLLKAELLSGSVSDFVDLQLHQKLTDLSQTFRLYTTMTNNLTTKYQQEIQIY